MEGKRIVVQGAFRKVSPWPLARARRGRAILLVGVVSPDGTLLADHLWVPFTPTLAALDLRPGMRVEGRGTVTRYRRADGSEDFKIANLRQVRQVEALPPPTAEQDLLTVLRARASAAHDQAIKIAGVLLHVHRVINPTGRKLGQGDYLASMLEARGQVWQLQQALGELQGLAQRIGTRPPEEEAGQHSA